VFSLLVFNGTALAQIEGAIELWNARGSGVCELWDTGDTREIYVVHTLHPGMIASRFRIAVDPRSTFTYISEDHHFPLTNGNVEDGITICYEECLPSSILLVTVRYMTYGTSENCSRLRVEPHPDAAVVESIRCDGVPVVNAVQDMSITYPSDSCGCFPRGTPGTPETFTCTPVPVESTTWGAIKALYTE